MLYLVNIRYGVLKNISRFRTKISGLRSGDIVIVRSSRGTELGEVASDPEEADGEFKDGGSDEIIRKANANDKENQRQIEEEIIPREISYCRKKVRELSVPMNLVSIEHLFGGKKIIVYYIAEKRIDFRELVKDLANEFQTRIEMKQIGVRDEARLLADYQHCGRELCCRTFLKDLEPVSMKMAKKQKATMDPSKISGRCGKLMCCLRYEDGVYNEFKNNLPRKGSFVKCSKCSGEVIGVEILAQNVMLETEDGKRVSVGLDDIQEQRPRKSPSKLKRNKKV